MERSKVIQSGMKKVIAVMCLTAALASTGCGQNALMNPTADQVTASGSTVNLAGHNLNPAGHDVNPASSQVKTSASTNLNP